MRQYLHLFCLLCLFPVALWSQEDGKAIFERASALTEKREYDQAWTLWEDAYARYESGRKWDTVVVITAKQAGILIRKGKLREAKELLDRSVQLAESHLGLPHPDLAETYHNYGILHYYQREYEDALADMESSLRMRKQQKNIKQQAASHSNIGLVHARLGQFDEAISHHQQAIQLYQKLGETAWARLAGAYNNAGTTYFRKGNHARAIPYYEQSLEIGKKLYGNTHPSFAKAYNNLGTCYNQLGNASQALEYYQLALSLVQAVYGENQLELVSYYGNIAISLRKQNRYQEAIQTYQKAIALSISHQAKGRDHLALLYLNIGLAYTNWSSMLERQLYPKQQRDSLHQQAVSFFRQALQQFDSKDSIRLAQIHGYIALSSDFLNDSLQARYHYQQALDLIPQAVEGKQNLVATILTNYGAFLWNKTKADQAALQLLQTSLQHLVPSFEPTSFYDQPAFFFSQSPEVLVVALKNKAAIFFELYEQKGQVKHLQAAEAHCALALGILDSLRGQYLLDDARAYWQQEAMRVYEQAMEIALKQYEVSQDKQHLWQAFEWVERGKAILLLEALKTTEAQQFAGIPDSLLSKEQALKTELDFYRMKWQKAYLKQKDQRGEDLQKLAKRKLEAKQLYESFLQELQSNYPKYYAFKYQQNIASVHQLQRDLLGQKDALLSYFLGLKQAYVFTLTHDDIQLRLFSQEEAFYEKLRAWRSMIASPPKVGQEQQDFALFQTYAHEFYQLLLEPSLRQQPDVEHLYIVPDGVLHYIPFGLLLQKQHQAAKDFRELAYVLKSYTCSYGYSASLLLENQQLQIRANHPYVGFAPYKPSNQTALSVRDEEGKMLPGAKQEVQTAHRLFGGEAYLGRKANREQFLQLPYKPQILHLAMHAFANDQNPQLSHLLFYADSSQAGRLYAYELYNLEINAQLAVLSACNTAYGQLQGGEGVMSLARAFLYAGCPSIMTSLWQADDQASQELVDAFFVNLQAGERKDVALQQAKIAYLANSSPQYAHPFYWGMFVVLGNTKPLQNDGPNLWLWGGLGFLLLLGIGLGSWWMKRKTLSTKS